MDEIKLDFKSSYIAAYLFLDSLYDKYVNHSENLSERDKDDFGKFMGDAFCPIGWSGDWQRALSMFYEREIRARDTLSIQISPRDTFTTLFLYVKSLNKIFGYCQLLVDILNGMINSPGNFESELKMWENALTNAFKGNHTIELDMWG